MSDLSSAQVTEVLRGQHAWLRRLAHHLVRGADGAEDAVQDTWVAVLRARPSADDDVRPWLAEVLRNVVRRQSRTRARRRTREDAAQAMAAETTAPAAEALERLQIQRLVTDLVAALDEPFRGTIVMRYLEDKSAAQIARALGVPEGTVRWRTKEALDRLRRQLDERSEGKRRAWVVALGPLVCGERGRLWWRWLVAAAGTLVIVASVAAISLRRGDVHETAPGKPTGWRAVVPRFLLSRGGAVSEVVEGVVRGPDGRGLAGALVTARVWQRGPGLATHERPRPAAVVVSGADGKFRFTGLAHDTYILAATHPQHAAAVDRAPTPLPDGAPHDLHLGGVGLAIAGRVSDTGGGVIAGAQVFVPGAWGAILAARTDSAGGYRLVLPKRAFGIYAEAAGYAPGYQNTPLDADGRRDFALLPSAAISGNVRAADGPVAGAQVKLLPLAHVGAWEEMTTAGADGTFEFRDLPASEYVVVARRGALVATAKTSTRAGDDPRVDLSLARGAVVRGRIRDLARRPITEAVVVVTVPESRSPFFQMRASSDGGYVIEGLPPRTLEIRFVAPGYVGRPTRVTPTGGDIELDLTAEAVSSVVGVIRKANGMPAAGAQVRGSAGGVGARAVADDLGRFELRGLGPGQAEVTAWLDREAILMAPIPLSVAERKDIVVALAPGAVVSGVVYDEQGRPVAGAFVRSSNERPVSRPGERSAHAIALEATRTDASGRFIVGPLLPGKVYVSAARDAGRSSTIGLAGAHTASVLLTAGQTVGGVVLTISSERQQVAGRAIDARGEALGGVTVTVVAETDGRAHRRDPAARQAVTGGDGTFVADRLGEGTFTVFAEHPSFPSMTLAGVPAGKSDLVLSFSHAAKKATGPSARPAR